MFGRRRSGGGRWTLAAAAAVFCAWPLATSGVASAKWEPAQRVDSAATGFGATYAQNAAATGANGLTTAFFFQRAPSTPAGAVGTPFAIRRAAGAATGWSAPAEIQVPAGQVAAAAGPALAAGADGGTQGVFAFQPSVGGAETLASSWPAAGAAPGGATPALCTSASTPECGASSPAVAIDGSGNAYAVASTSLLSGDVLFSRTDPSTGAWQPAQVVAQGAVPQIAVDPAGDATISYSRPDPAAPSAPLGPFYRLYGKRAPAGGAFGSEQLLSGPDNTVDNIFQAQTALVTDAAGNATVAFPQGTTVPAIGGGPNTPAAFAVRWPAGGAPQAPQQLSGSPHGNAGHVVLAVDPQGSVTAAWDESSPNSAVFAAQNVSGSSFGTAQQVSPGNGFDSFSGPQVAADAAGTATLVYFDQPNPTAAQALDAQRKPAGGPWQAPVAISRSGTGAGGVQGTSIHVVAGPTGQADATFVQSLNGTNQLLAARFDRTAPTLSTNASGGVAVGGSIRDTATLADGSSPTGTISFTLYGPDDADCTGTPAFTSGPVTVSGNGSYVSPSFSPTTAGVYRWTATYSGDADNTPAGGACNALNESVTVFQTSTTVTTNASPGVALGHSIHDRATLAGGRTPTGKIDFAVYGPDDASCSGAPAFTDSVSVSGNGHYRSANFAPGSVGTYRWIAAYSGDGKNAAASTACNEGSESAVVSQARASLTTHASPKVAIGHAVHDTATLAGGQAPGGRIGFRLYGPGDRKCSGRPVFRDGVTVSGNGGYRSTRYVPKQPGVYRWVARYSGDTGNRAVSARCGSRRESVRVRRASPKLRTHASVRGGDRVGDRAVLRGGHNPTGLIVFRLYGRGDGRCSRAPVFLDRVPVGGNGSYDSARFAARHPGTYRFTVVYKGDPKNRAARSGCHARGESVAVSGTSQPR